MRKTWSRDSTLAATPQIYSDAVVASGVFIFTAGQVGRDPETNQLADGIEAQADQALRNLEAVLRACGSDMTHVVRILVFLSDLSDGPQFNAAYTRFFPDSPPARTRVIAGALAPGCLVEMEAIAIQTEEGGL